MALFILTKICKTCLSELPLSDFHKYQRIRGGFSLECKFCKNKKNRQDYDRNCSIYLETRRQRREKDPEKYREYTRQYRIGVNLEKHREANRKWRLANIEKHNEFNRNWSKINYERKKISQYKWVRANPEKNKDIHRRAKYRRRSRSANTRQDLTIIQWQQIKDFYHGKCAFCGKKPIRLTQDHVIPVSKGGDHTAANIIPLCQPCNSRKGNRDIKISFQPHLFMAV